MPRSSREETDLRYALCIGINSYAPSAALRPLQYAEEDARAMYEVLLQRGFAREHCRLLLGAEATTPAIQDALLELLLNKPKRNDLVLFYFAGHGVRIPSPGDDDDETMSDVFLTSYDFDRQSLAQARGAWLNYPLRFGHLREGFFEKTRSNKVLFLLDSCDSGDFFGAKYREDTSIQHFLDQSFAKMSAGRLVLSSCLPLQKAREEEMLGHGLFTYHLLQALHGRVKDAVRPNGMMTVSSLFDYLDDIMPPTQRPVEGGVKHGSFELLYYPQWDTTDQPSTIPPAPIGPIFDVPGLPVLYVDRPEVLASLSATLQERNIVGLVAALFGQGGIGKTFLATLLCHDAAVRECFPDGILWATLGQDADEQTVKVIQHGWLTLFGVDITSITTLSEGKEQLKQLLEGRTMLLVLDDVWNEALAQWVCCSSPTVRVLMTTRDISQIPDAYQYRLDVLPREQSCALLMQVSDGRITAKEADELAELVGDLPLGLSVLGGQMSDKHVTWRALKAEFQKNLLADFPDEFNHLIYASLQTSINALGDKKQRYLELAIFPNKVRLEPDVIIRYWFQTAGLSEFAAQRLLSLMVQKSLIQKDNTLHDLPHAYLQYITTLEERTVWHNALIATHGGSDTWGNLPDDGHQYAWRHFAWHLAQANRHGDLRSLLFNASYLQHKIERMKSFSLNSDIALLPHDPDIILLGKTIRLGRHILDETPAELPNQIKGRTGTSLFSVMHHWPTWTDPHLELRTATLQQAGGDLLRIMQHQAFSVSHCSFSPNGRYALSASVSTNDFRLHLWDVQTGESLHVFKGHTSPINACTFSPNSRYVVSASGVDYSRTRIVVSASGVQYSVKETYSSDNTLRLWDVQTGESLQVCQEHTRKINACAFSPDSCYALSASDDNTLRLWDVQTGKCLQVFQGQTGKVHACAFSPNGRYVLGASTEYFATDCVIRLQNVQTGEVLYTFSYIYDGNDVWRDFFPDNEYVYALSPDGHYALTEGVGGYYRTYQVWNVQTRELLSTLHKAKETESEETDESIRIFQGKIGEFHAYAFSSDDQYALSASGELSATDYVLRLWDVQTGKNVHTFRGHTGEINTCIFSPDGRYILSASGLPNRGFDLIDAEYDDTTLRLWDVQTGEGIYTFQGHTGEVNACAFSPDGRSILSASKDGTLRLWDVQTGESLRIFRRHTEGVVACAFSPDGHSILSASKAVLGILSGRPHKSPLRLWDVQTGECIHTFQGHPNGVSNCAFSPDGQYVLSAGDTTLRLWDVQTEKSTNNSQGHTGGVECVFSPDGQYVLSWSHKYSSDDYTLRLWDVQTGEPIRLFQGNTHAVWVCSFSPDGRYILSMSEDSTLRLWDVQTGKFVHNFWGRSHHPSACSFSPDGQYVLSSSRGDTSFQMWDVRTGKSVHIFQGHTHQVEPCSFSPDGRSILSAGAGTFNGRSDHTIRQWDVQTGKPVHIWENNTPVLDWVFGPDGFYVLNVSNFFDPMIKLWEMQKEKLLRTFKGHTEVVNFCKFSPDGHYILSASNDWTLRLWDIQTERPVHIFQGQRAFFSRDGRYIVALNKETFWLWDVQTGKSILHWQGDSPLSCVAIDHKGQFVVIGDDSGSLHFFTIKHVLMGQAVPQPPNISMNFDS